MIRNTSLSFRHLMIVTLKQFTISVLVLLKLNIYFFWSSKVCRTLNQHAYNNVSCGIAVPYCCLSSVLLPVLLALYVYSYYHLYSNRLGVSMVSCCMFVICVMVFVV